jgi:hypothetical protein
LLLSTLIACSASDEGDGTPADAAVRLDAAERLDTHLVDQPAPAPDQDQATPDSASPDMPCPDPGIDLVPGVTVSPTNLAPGGQATIVYGPPRQLAAASNLTLHYGFNYWGLDLGGGDTSGDAPMTPQSNGTYSTTIKLPAGARLLDFVFFTQKGDNKEWDNNKKADFHRSVGKPRYGPYLTLRDNLKPAPDRDPAHSIVVSFRTDWPCVGQVRHGTSPGQLGSVTSATATATDHHLRLKGLKADTVYHYQVSCVDETTCRAPEIGQVHSFRTAAKASTAVKFIHLADPQYYRAPNDRWDEVAEALTKPPHDDARFVVISGDLASDDVPMRWWDFFDRGRKLFATKPMVPAVGNHDTPTYGSDGNTATFEALFDFDSSSGTDTYYGLVYGPTAFLVLNSETSQPWVSTSDWRPGGTQYSWAKAALGKLAAPWRFAVWHIPPYNAGVRHVDQCGETQHITALFNDTVDWVLCGHEHLYQRFKPLRYAGLDGAGDVISKTTGSYGGAGGGVGYLIAPPAGHDPPADKLVEPSHPMRARLASPPPVSRVQNKVAQWVGFVVVNVSGKTIDIKAYALGQAAPVDDVSYKKP